MTITRIPKKDKDLILFLKNFIATLEPNLALLGISAAEFEALKTMAININAQGNQATAEKNDYTQTTHGVRINIGVDQQRVHFQSSSSIFDSLSIFPWMA